MRKQEKVSNQVSNKVIKDIEELMNIFKEQAALIEGLSAEFSAFFKKQKDKHNAEFENLIKKKLNDINSENPQIQAAASLIVGLRLQLAAVREQLEHKINEKCVIAPHIQSQELETIRENLNNVSTLISNPLDRNGKEAVTSTLVTNPLIFYEESGIDNDSYQEANKKIEEAAETLKSANAQIKEKTDFVKNTANYNSSKEAAAAREEESLKETGQTISATSETLKQYSDNAVASLQNTKKSSMGLGSVTTGASEQKLIDKIKSFEIQRQNFYSRIADQSNYKEITKNKLDSAVKDQQDKDAEAIYPLKNRGNTLEKTITEQKEKLKSGHETYKKIQTEALKKQQEEQKRREAEEKKKAEEQKLQEKQEEEKKQQQKQEEERLRKKEEEKQKITENKAKEQNEKNQKVAERIESEKPLSEELKKEIEAIVEKYIKSKNSSCFTLFQNSKLTKFKIGEAEKLRKALYPTLEDNVLIPCTVASLRARLQKIQDKKKTERGIFKGFRSGFKKAYDEISKKLEDFEKNYSSSNLKNNTNISSSIN